MRKLLLFAWLPLVVFLFPLPPQAAKQLQDEIYRSPTAEGSSVSGGAKGLRTEQALREELDMFTSAMWLRWMQTLGLLVAGLFVGVMAWRGYRHWQWFALGMSVVYLAFVLFRYLFMDRAIPDSWLFFQTDNHFLRVVQANLRVVEVGISNGSFMRPASVIYDEILMPLFQIAVLAWVLWLFSRKQGQPT